MPPRKALEHASSYTVGWIAALAHERAAALVMLDERHDKPKDFVQNRGDENSYSWGRISQHNVVIASLPAGEYGLVSAADTASGMRASLPNVRIGLLVGIGAGIPGEEVAPDGTFNVERDLLLGDVVVSNPDGTNGGVVQYDLYKAKTGAEAGEAVRERKGFLNSPPRALRTALAALQAEHEIEEPRMAEYLEAFEQNAKMKIPYGYPGTAKDHLRHPESRCTPAVHYGIIASGNTLIKNSKERNDVVSWLKSENINPLCYEMEAAGLMNNFPCMVIRGVCDYANERKNDDWQKYAAATAAAFAKELLQYVDSGEVEMSPKLAEMLGNIYSKVDNVEQHVQQLVGAGEERTRQRNRQQILDWLNPPNPRAPLTAKREPGTNLWFIEGELFQSWVEGSQPCVFLHGGVGCGKTTLSKAVAGRDELRNARVISFYFSSTTNEQYGLNALLRFLVAQLAGPGRVPDSLQSLYENHNRAFPPEPPDDDAELQSLVEALLSEDASKHSAVCYLLIDGLDEITLQSRRRSVTNYLNTLAAHKLSNLRILVTSRPAEFTSTFTHEWTKVQIPLSRVRDDIELYVTRRISQTQELASLEHGLRLQIVSKLAGPGQSMFRYAYLQLERLLDSRLLLRSDVSKTLENLPPTLNQTYDAIIHEINPLHQDLALIALRWLTFAQQPLRIEELIEACTISLENGGHLSTQSRLTPEQMLILLPNLISIDSEMADLPCQAGENFTSANAFVTFAHFSVKEYLLNGMAASLGTQFNLDVVQSHKSIARSCIAYLANSNTRHLRSAYFPLRTYAWELWSLHTMFAFGSVDDALSLAQPLFEHVAMSEPATSQFPFSSVSEGYGRGSNRSNFSVELQQALLWLENECNLADALDSLQTPYFFNEFVDTKTVGSSMWEPLNAEDFRLVTLQPSQHGFTTPRCSTSVVSLNSPPNYEAMSYSWGSHAESSYVWLNGNATRVTKNAAANLRNLRNGQAGPRILWIDILCINQADLQERTVQVGIMARLFSGADQVAICLSNPEDDAWALKIVTQVAKLVKSFSRDGLEELQLVLRTDRGRDPFESIRRLFKDTWYSRTWTVQEAVLGKKAVILYGTDPLPFETLQLVVNHEYEMSRLIQIAQPGRELDESRLLASPEWETAKALCIARQHHHASGANRASSLLFGTRFHRTHMVHDRFYSLLHMFPASVSNRVRIDYSQSALDAVIDALHAIITAEGNLDLYSMLTLEGTPIADKRSPSWAKDFVWDPEIDHPLPLLLPELTSGHDSGFCAGGTSFDRPPWIDEHLHLHLEGFIFDVIEGLGEMSEGVSTFPDHFDVERKLSLHRQSCFTSRGFQCLVPSQSQPEHCIAILIGAKTPFVLAPIGQEIESARELHGYQDEHYPRKIQNILNRKAYKTTTTTLSRDRSQYSISSGVLRLIGECYVRGAMHGELLASAKESGRYVIGPVVLG